MIMENKGENTYEESDFYRNAGSWKEYGRSGCRKNGWEWNLSIQIY